VGVVSGASAEGSALCVRHSFLRFCTCNQERRHQSTPRCTKCLAHLLRNPVWPIHVTWREVQRGHLPRTAASADLAGGGRSQVASALRQMCILIGERCFDVKLICAPNQASGTIDIAS
jgi:hypothetical protein